MTADRSGGPDWLVGTSGTYASGPSDGFAWPMLGRSAAWPEPRRREGRLADDRRLGEPAAGHRRPRSPGRAWPSIGRRSPSPAAGAGSRPQLAASGPVDAGDRRADQAARQLRLPGHAGRRAAGRRRHDPRRRLGRLLLGPLLGLGPEGGLGADHPAGLPGPAPRPVRRLGQHVRPGRAPRSSASCRC